MGDANNIVIVFVVITMFIVLGIGMYLFFNADVISAGLNNNANDYDNLLSQQDDLNQEISDLRTANLNLEFENQQLRNQLQEITLEENSYNDDLCRRLRDEREDIKDDIDDTEDDIDDIKDEIDEREENEEDTANLEDELEDLRDDLDDLDDDLDEIEDRMDYEGC